MSSLDEESKRLDGRDSSILKAPKIGSLGDDNRRLDGEVSSIRKSKADRAKVVTPLRPAKVAGPGLEEDGKGNIIAKQKGEVKQERVVHPIPFLGYTHPFKGRVTDVNEITIGPGRVRSLDLAGPAEMLDILQADTAVGSLSGSGTIWAQIRGAFLQIENKTAAIPDHNHGDVSVTPDGSADLSVKTYRYVSETGVYAYTDTPDAFGFEWASNADIFVPILDFETTDGQVAITVQRVVDDIFVTDSYCTITAS
jgi:hypothetical protein